MELDDEMIEPNDAPMRQRLSQRDLAGRCSAPRTHASSALRPMASSRSSGDARGPVCAATLAAAHANGQVGAAEAHTPGATGANGLSVLAAGSERRPADVASAAPVVGAGGAAGVRGHHRRAHSTAGGPLRLSDLELLRELGEGALAQVVACRRRGQSHEFALKVLHKRSLLLRNQQSHAIAEKAALAACRSPHVVTLYYALSDAEHWCLLLELCPGGDLQAAVERGGPLSARAATWLCAEVASGLAHLHAAGWAHRDVKPENVGLSAAGHAKLLDLGTARRLDGRAVDAPGGSASAGGSGAARAGGAAAAAAEDGGGAEGEAAPFERRAQPTERTAGTAAYVCPAVASGAHPGGEAGDLWSLGCLLFAALAGQSPFAAPTEYLALSRAASGAYEWPEGAAVPAEVAAAVRLLLHPQPDARLLLGAEPPAAAGRGGGDAGAAGPQPGRPGSWLAAFAQLPAFAALPAPPDALHGLQPPPLHDPPPQQQPPPQPPVAVGAAVAGGSSGGGGAAPPSAALAAGGGEGAAQAAAVGAGSAPPRCLRHAHTELLPTAAASAPTAALPGAAPCSLHADRGRAELHPPRAGCAPSTQPSARPESGCQRHSQASHGPQASGALPVAGAGADGASAAGAHWPRIRRHST